MYKKIFKKVSAIVMAVSIFSLLGCSSIDENQAAEVENLLKDKYKQEFKVTHIGGRYGTANNDTVLTYVHPVDNENIVFQAEMNKDGLLESDSYIPRIISNQLNEILKQELEVAGIESESISVVMNANSSSETNSNITLKEYVTKYQPGYFSGDLIIKETPNITGEQFNKPLTSVYEAGLNTTFQVAIHVISQEDYEACLDEFKKLSMVTDEWFRDYNVVDEMKVYIDSEGFHIFEDSKSATN